MHNSTTKSSSHESEEGKKLTEEEEKWKKKAKGELKSNYKIFESIIGRREKLGAAKWFDLKKKTRSNFGYRDYEYHIYKELKCVSYANAAKMTKELLDGIKSGQVSLDEKDDPEKRDKFYSPPFEALRKVLTKMIRWAPTVEAAENYFNEILGLFPKILQKTNEGPHHLSYPITCLIYVHAVVPLKPQDINTKRVDELMKIAKETGSFTKVTEHVYQTYVKRVGKSVSDEKGSTSTFLTFSSSKTMDIKNWTSIHASQRMDERDISLEEVKECLLRGSRDIDGKGKDEKQSIYKAYNGNIVVIFAHVRTNTARNATTNHLRINILTTYRKLDPRRYALLMKNVPTKSFRHTMDAIMSKAQFDSFEDAKDLMLKKLIPDYMSGSIQKKDLLSIADLLYFLAVYCAPTMGDAIEILKIADEYKISLDGCSFYQ